MVEIQADLRLADPTSLQPDTPTEFTLEYANRNSDHRHRIETVTIAPTWNLTEDSCHDLDQVIPADSRQQLPPITIHTPTGLGGHHGLDIAFTVSTPDSDHQIISRRVPEPLTVPVTGARHLQAVVCPATSGELPATVRRLLQQWGFDIYVAEDVQAVTDRFTEFADSPIVFAGVTPDGADETGRQRVSSGAWAADDRTKLSFILTEQGVQLPELPDATAVFRADLTDQRALLQETGPELLTERQSLQIGESARLHQLLEKSKTTAGQGPREALRALAHSRLSHTTGTPPENVVEAIDTPGDFLSTNQTEPSRQHPPWPMRGADPQNTGHHSAQAGPTTTVTNEWQYETDGTVRSSPAVVDDTVFVGSEDHHVYALDAETGRVRWQYETDGTVRSSPAVVDGTVYVGSGDHYVYALDAKTGRVRWQYETDGEVWSSPAVVDDTVYIKSFDYQMYALDANTGRVRWQYKTKGAIQSSPAIINDTIYVTLLEGYVRRVYALDAETGQVRWQYETIGCSRSSPAVVNGTVYVGSHDNHVYALDAGTGRVRWQYETDSNVNSSPAVVGDTVYIGSNDDDVYALDAGTGRVRWQYETDGPVVSSPVVVNSTVYVGSHDNHVYALDAGTGRIRWQYETDGVASAPAVVDGTVYVGSGDNYVYALTEQ